MKRGRATATHGAAAAAGLALGLTLGHGSPPPVAPIAPVVAGPAAALPEASTCYTLVGTASGALIAAVSDEGDHVVLRFSDPPAVARAAAHACYLVRRAGELGDTVNPDALFVLREIP